MSWIMRRPCRRIARERMTSGRWSRGRWWRSLLSPIDATVSPLAVLRARFITLNHRNCGQRQPLSFTLHHFLAPGFTGNLFQISYDRNWEGFAALGPEYGTYFPLSYKSFLLSYYKGYIIHKVMDGSATLEKQNIRCSITPHLTMASDLVSLKKGMDCDDRFRRYRKLFYVELPPAASTQFTLRVLIQTDGASLPWQNQIVQQRKSGWFETTFVGW